MFDSTASAGAVLAALVAAAREESAVVARKLALAAEFERLRRAEDARDHVPVRSQAEFVAAEVAAALSVSTGAAHTLMSLGHDLAVRLPEVRRALAAGELDLARVRVIVDRTATIDDPAVLAEVQRRVLEVVLLPGRCVTRGQVARVVDRVVASVDPALVRARRERAVADRQITVRPAEDGMCTVWGALPAPDGVALDTRLRAMAMEVCSADPRTLAQLRADAVVALAHGHSSVACECGSLVCPSSATEQTHHTCRPVVQVVVAAETLAEAADLPGVLTGYGIVDADVVRALAADARWQRLLTVDGVPRALGSTSGAGLGAGHGRGNRAQRRRAKGRTKDMGTPTRPAPVLDPAVFDPAVFDPAVFGYAPSRALAALVRARDGHCRFPGCTTPATSCDLDHVNPFHHDNPRAGGRTEAGNLACLCRWHHRAKTQGYWQVRMDPDGTQHWTGPTGQTFTTTPDGMPPRQRDSPARLHPVAPIVSSEITPPDGLPQDNPPDRWTSKHRTDDPCTGHDIDTALDALIREFNGRDRDTRPRILIPHRPPPHDEPPPF